MASVPRVWRLSLVLAGVLGLGIWAWAAAPIERRLWAFQPEALSPRGQEAYRLLLDVERVDSLSTRWMFGPVESTHRLVDLWDERPELASQALLSLCEYGTLAARFYALAALSQSDPWTFERAYLRYGHSQETIHVQDGCVGTVGPFTNVFQSVVAEGRLAHVWRGYWCRTERSGPGFDRILRAYEPGD